MNESNLKAPTKKAFHFPKGEASNAANEGSVAPVTPEPAKRARAATRKKAGAGAASETSATATAAVSPAAPKKAATRKATVKKPVAAKPVAEKATVAKPAGKKASPKKSAATKDAASPAVSAPKADTTSVEKVKREKKEKVVRDSFTMPKSDYAKIAVLKQKCLDAGVHVKKSELLRAGLVLLEGVSEKRLAAVLADLETVKTGRPAND